MGVRAGIIECPFCKSHLQDTKQEYINCKHCGKRFSRGTVKEEEDKLRRNMVLDLSDQVQKMKALISAGKMFGAVLILLGVLLLFSNVFELYEILLTVAFLANGIVWIVIASVVSSRLEKTQSKMFDLSGGRDVFEY